MTPAESIKFYRGKIEDLVRAGTWKFKTQPTEDQINELLDVAQHDRFDDELDQHVWKWRIIHNL